MRARTPPLAVFLAETRNVHIYIMTDLLPVLDKKLRLSLPGLICMYSDGGGRGFDSSWISGDAILEANLATRYDRQGVNRSHVPNKVKFKK